MPRKARKKSSMNIYHVILRGINHQIIFEDKHDHVQFISIMKHYKKLCGFKLYAYCLMDNHVHLLIEDADIPLDEIMKKIEVKFVRWYNRKYDRTGNLFQERYKSEPVNNTRYFQTVFRYIHQNPLHAGLERVPGVYPWSSYEAYVVTDDSFIDVDRVLELFGSQRECMDYLNTDSDEKCMEHVSSYCMSDRAALDVIREQTPCISPSDFQHLELYTRNQYLKMLHHAGISKRQLSRLTGISRTVIDKAVRGV